MSGERLTEEVSSGLLQIGMLTPHATAGPEREFPAMAPGCVVNRVVRLADSERAETVRHALLQLAEPYRVVVVLRHYEGLKFREIGEVLDIPEGTVKSRMVEALNQLSRALKPLVS